MHFTVAPSRDITGAQYRWKRGIFTVPWGSAALLVERAVKEATQIFLQKMEQRGLRLASKDIRIDYGRTPDLDDRGNAVQKVIILAPFIESLRTRKFTVDETLAEKLTREFPNRYKLLE